MEEAEKQKLEEVADDEIAEVASLITRAFRGLGWHTEEEIVSGFTMTEEQLRKQISIALPHGKLLQWKDENMQRLGTFFVRPVDEQRNKWRLGWVAVEPTLQTNGVGKKLLQYAEEYAQQNGATIMCLTAMNVRKNLIAWYDRRGYKPTGEIEPFVYTQDLHGAVLRDDLGFVVLEKVLC